MRKNNLLKFLVLSFSFLIFTSKAEAIYMVVGKQSPIKEISNSQIKDIYVGISASQAGMNVLALDRKEESSKIRERFFKNVLGKNMTQMRSLWSQLIFTGRGYPPAVVDSLQDIVRKINENNAYAAFVDVPEFDPNTMKIVFAFKGP
jgi:hypothetical protein